METFPPAGGRTPALPTDTTATRVVRYLQQPLGLQSVALMGLLVLALLYTLTLAREFLLPIVIALLLNFVLSPVVRGLRRLRIPATLGAALVLIALIGATSGGVYLLAEPAGEWMAKVPQSLRSAQAKIRQLREPVEKVNQAAKEVENLTRMGRDKRVQEVEISGGSLAVTLLSSTWSFLASTVVVAVLLFFLLASGDRFLRKLMRLVPASARPGQAAELLRSTERQVSAYLATVSLINGLLGVAVFIAMYFLGMPNPLLWGVMASFLNFVPYLGAVVGVGIITLVSAVSYDALGPALLPPLVYLGLTALEGSFITPLILGRRFSLSPVMIILWLLLWGWMWGIAGALLAVPMLTVVKIFCEHAEPLAPISDLLGV